MIINPDIEEYILNMHKKHPILKEMEDFGRSLNFPILGPMVGTILLQFTLAINAKRIMELGSGFGYSAFWFAMGLQDDGKIYCTDYSVKNKQIAEEYFSRAGLEKKINFSVGDAIEFLNQAEGKFDIILNDIQKTSYPIAFENMLSKLRPGGVLISDNVLWKGKVVSPSDDETIKAIREFNQLIFNSDKVVSTILPIRDGISISIKK